MILRFVMLPVGVSVAPYQIAQNGSTTATVTGSNMDGTVSVEVWNNDLSAKITSGVVVTPGEGSTASRMYEIKISADFELGDYKVVPTINGVRQTGVAGASLKVTDTPVGEYTVSGTITGSDAPGGLAADVQLKQNGVNVGAPVKAGADGKYVISNVAPGIGYTIYATMSGYSGSESESFGIIDADVDEINIELSLVLGPYSVSGRVVNYHARKGVAATVKVFRNGNEITDKKVTAGADGTFTIEGLEPNNPTIDPNDKYNIVASYENQYMQVTEEGESGRFDLTSDITFEKDIVLTYVPAVGDLKDWVEHYRVSAYILPGLNLIEIWVNDENISKVDSISYKGEDFFKPDASKPGYYMLSIVGMPDVAEIKKGSVLSIVTIDTVESYCDNFIGKTYAKIYLKLATGVIIENVEVSVDGKALKHIEGNYFSGQISPARLKGEKVPVTVKYNGDLQDSQEIDVVS